MKYITNSLLILPLLGFLAAGCSTSSNLQSSEVDDVYFSTKDKVTYVEPAMEATSEEESYASDTEYSESGDVTERVSDPETYAERRRSSSNNTYQYSYYDAPFGNPFWAYQTPFYYPGRYYSRAVLVDPWLDPWYDPFYGPSMAVYDPFWPRPGFSMGIGIGIGYGRVYNPWGYGYGYGGGYGYNPYRSGYYDGYYGGGVAASRVAYGPRDDRGSNAGGRNPNISRESRGNIASPAGSRTSNAVIGSPTSRSRTRSSAAAETDGTVMPRRRQVSSTPQPQSGGEIITAPSRSSNSSTPGTQSTQPSRRQRSVEYTPAPTQRTESRSRSYEPAPTRTYEPAPSRTYESSGSSGSSSGGSSSGGSSSGGSRRGRN